MLSEFIGIVLGMVGIAVVVQAFMDRLTRHDVTPQTLLKNAVARFPCAKSIQLFERPSIERGSFGAKQKSAFYMRLVDDSGAVVLVDVSWAGKLSLEQSMAKMTADIALGGMDVHQPRARNTLLQSINGSTVVS